LYGFEFASGSIVMKIYYLFSEVQLGDYFGEDDIIRYSDKYGRVKVNQ